MLPCSPRAPRAGSLPTRRRSGRPVSARECSTRRHRTESLMGLETRNGFTQGPRSLQFSHVRIRSPPRAGQGGGRLPSHERNHPAERVVYSHPPQSGEGTLDRRFLEGQWVRRRHSGGPLHARESSQLASCLR